MNGTDYAHATEVTSSMLKIGDMNSYDNYAMLTLGPVTINYNIFQLYIASSHASYLNKKIA